MPPDNDFGDEDATDRINAIDKELAAAAEKGWAALKAAWDPLGPPQQWYVCDACDGSGEEVFGYWGCEPGCGHPHVMEEGRPCGKCNGEGGWVDDVEPNERESTR